MPDDSQTALLLQRALDGEPGALGDLLMRDNERLTRVVKFRMDPRLRGRVDASDVVQEAFLEATTRFDEYKRDAKMPFFLWLRFLTMQQLCALHRRHLGVQARDVSRDISLFNGPSPEITSAVLAAQLIGKLTTPSQAAIRAETRLRLEEALNSMEPIDREVLAMRHFEWLSNQETARLLGIAESAASNRYVRAVKRLRFILDGSG